ncbi:MAG: hypothetical protein ACOX1A_09890 [Saccharofermentanales bacterium]
MMTAEGQGTVESVNLLKETVTVRLDRGGESDLVALPSQDVEIVDDKPEQRGQGSYPAAHQLQHREDSDELTNRIDPCNPAINPACP